MEDNQAEFKKLSFSITKSSGEKETMTLPINKIQPWRLEGDRGGFAAYWVFIGTRAELKDISITGQPAAHLIRRSVSVSEAEYERLVKEKNSVDINHTVV